MRERAEELGGTLTISAGEGTRVHAELPLPKLPPQAGPPCPAGAGAVAVVSASADGGSR